MHGTATVVAGVLFYSAAVSFAQAPNPVDAQLVMGLRRGDCRSVEGLLKKGANPNARDDEGATALIRAALVCQPAVLTQLIDRGADVNARDDQGRSPLVLAIVRDPPDSDFARRQMDVIKLLIARKASLANKDEDGNTLLHYAARQRNVEVVKLLLASGVPVDGRNKDGATPLFFAAADGRATQVALAAALIAAGADVNARDNSGLSVLSVATERDSDVARMLRERGARADAPAKPAPSAAPPGGNPLAPIDGVSLEAWARANGRLAAEVPLETVIAPLKMDKARWERVNDQWTERLAQHAATIGNEYAKIFRATMDEEAAKRGEPAVPIPFEKWVEVQQASSAASAKLPTLYGMSRADWSRVNAWWNQRLKAKTIDSAVYAQLSAKYEKQFAVKPPAQSRPVLREGALETNTEPVPLEVWVEMQQADTAAQVWTLKRHGLTTGQWIRATGYWGRKFNEALLSLNTGTPDERRAKQQMNADHQRLSEIYARKYAQGLPWQ